LFLFVLLTKSEGNEDSGLPFEDSDLPFEESKLSFEESNLPFDDSENIPEKEDIPETTEEEEIVKEEKEVKPTPTPPPRVKIPLKKLFKVQDFACIALLVLFVVFYIFGRISNSKQAQKIIETISPHLSKYFAVSKAQVKKLTDHDFQAYVTGRKGYYGCLIRISFACDSDPIGLIYSMFKGQSSQISFEFVIRPRDTNGILLVQKEKPEWVDKLHLKTRSVVQGYSCFNDFGQSKEPFITKIEEFLNANPNSIQLINLTDQNPFCTRDSSPNCAKITFKFSNNLPEFMINGEMVSFAIDIADMYATLRLEPDVQNRNKNLRISIINQQKKENENKKKEDEKKKELDPLEKERKLKKEKMEKREEKREKRGASPKFRPSFIKG